MKNRSTPESLTDPQTLVKLAGLYDIYGELIKENSRDIFADYVLENLSLSEIAEDRGISRQGVYDSVVRTAKKLEEFEEKVKRWREEEKNLGDSEVLYSKWENRTSELNNIIEKVAGIDNDLKDR